MATKSLNNPFADYGGIVKGERFIGRKESIDQIANRVLGREYGNLSIVGLPRVGKSSLAWHAIMDKRDELIKSNTIPIFFGVGSCKSSTEFFKKMVILLSDELDLICEDEKYHMLATKYIEAIKEEYDINLVQKYFRIVKHFGYKTIFILDEFDSVLNFFEMPDFQFLRELSYNPDIKLCLVTCSRKDIEDIEVKEGAVSNFSGIFSQLRLSMFSDDDVSLYWEHFDTDWEVTDRYKNYVYYFTGNHPWLMDMVNNIMFNQDITGELNSKFDNVKLELMDALDKIVSTIEKEQLLNSAIQLVVGPYDNPGQKETEKLLKFGFIKKEHPEYKKKLFGSVVGPTIDEYCYICFSPYSTLDLYRRYYANLPYSGLWSKTENSLRFVIKEFLRLNFSGDWENELTNLLMNNPPYPKFDIEMWKKNLASLKNTQKKMCASFPTMKESHTVDFTLTAQLFDLFIMPNWLWFNTIFKGAQSDWKKKFYFLVNFRNPVAHNNLAYLEELEKVATVYCKEVCSAIDNWRKDRNEEE